jgi:hypothetical protein
METPQQRAERAFVATLGRGIKFAELAIAREITEHAAEVTAERDRLKKLLANLVDAMVDIEELEYIETLLCQESFATALAEASKELSP